MGKVLKIAAVVVAVAAAIPTGGTSLLAAGVASAGIASGVAATAIASGLAVGLNVAAGLTAKKPKVSGVQTSWSADPDAPVPIIFGRTLMSGEIRYRKQHGSKNKWDTLTSVLSGCGPIHSIQQTYMEKLPIGFSGGLNGVHKIAGKDRIWQRVQLGACPEPSYLVPPKDVPPNWTPAHKLSGYAAVLNTFEYDASGKDTLTSTPRFNWLGEGVLCWDPRQDSSYPGGSGPCRADDPATWVYSECGWIQALTFALGWHQGPNGIRVGGVGMDVEDIDIPAFVEAANIADANAWKSGGRVTTADDKWEVMKSLAQAGGGEPIRYGAILSCFVNAPRVSIGTIYAADLIGTASISTAQTIRDRVNGITPRYTSEDHFWEQVPAGTVQRADYLVADRGRERTKMVAYPMVQCAAGETPDQAAQLAAYDIANAREAGPIVLPLKLRWLGYRAGDCLTMEDHPAFGRIRGKDVIIIKRQIDPTTAAVTLTVRTETSSKHPWALSRVGVPAPSTDNSTPIPYDPDPATDPAVTPWVGAAAFAWRNPTSANFGYSYVYRGTSKVFGSAVQIAGPIVGGLGQVQQITDTVAPGVYYYWVRAFDNDGDPAEPTGSVPASVAAPIINGGNVSVAEMSGGLFQITKISGGTDWNASAVSSVGITGGATARLTAPSGGQVVAGLDASPNASDSWEDIDYCVYFQSNGALNSIESGVHTTIGTAVAGDVIWIVQSADGSTISYRKGPMLAGSTLLRSVSVTPATLYFDSSISDEGQSFVAGLFKTA